jgi:hypothetical protein
MQHTADRMNIRQAQISDADAIWAIIEPVIRAGETYALPRNMSKAEALEYWMGPDRQTFVAEDADRLLGTYYLRPNQLGGGAHVANCGYITAASAVGRGGYRACDVRGLNHPCACARISCHAVQLRGQHERARCSPLESFGLCGSRSASRRILTSESGRRRCVCYVQASVRR